MNSNVKKKVLDGTVWDEFCDAPEEAGCIVQSEKSAQDAFNQRRATAT